MTRVSRTYYHVSSEQGSDLLDSEPSWVSIPPLSLSMSIHRRIIITTMLQFLAPLHY